MAEKRGATEKLKYPFNSAGVLEVFMNEKWYRVTGKEFRSFDGLRRITEPTRVELGNVVDIPMRTYDYEGPVFLFATNTQVPYTGAGKIAESEHWRNMLQISQSRG